MRAIDIASDNATVFVAYENGLLRYHLESKEKTLLNKLNGLSDILLSCLFYDSVGQALYVGYKNGNIDQIIGDRIYNIPAIRLASFSGSKKINRFYRTNNGIYVCTDFGIVLLNPDKKEIKDTYYPTNGEEPIVDITLKDQTLFALSPTRLFTGNESAPLLPAPQGWTHDVRLQEWPYGVYAAIEKVNEDVFVLARSTEFGNDTVLKLIPTEFEVFQYYSSSLEIANLAQHNNLLDVLADGALLSLDAQGGLQESVLSFYLGIYFRPNQMVVLPNGNKWMADELSGPIRTIGEYSYEKITYPGPPRNDFYSMDWNKGKLAVASGRLEFKSPGFLRHGYYLFENEDWYYNDKSTLEEWQGIDIHDFIDIAVNPKNPDEVAISTYSRFPLSIVDTKTNSCSVYDSGNSPIQLSFAGNGWALASDVAYDSKGNLWVLNGWSERPLVARQADGTWWSYDCGVDARNKYTTKMVLDKDNNVWFATETNGLFGYNYSKTFDNTGDDQKINLSSGDYTGALPAENITALAVDLDGELWIGTDAGFAVLYNPSGAFNAAPGDYNAQRIKVRFEGNVEYMLGSTHITDIEVDGGNRKWMATSGAGLVLLSSDGSEIIRQFTKENSALISNNIYDIKINQETGELFIITDLGLVSYRSDASQDDADYSSTKVFPNPVRPGYEGLITIQGIRYDSDVKITDVAGNLVFKTTSNGGTATWDGKRVDGSKVVSGVYLIWTATNEGTSRKVGKVVVVN
ncbi:MAG: T9SS type A sorting domain-containing protein [Bacteroidota bacterium]